MRELLETELKGHYTIERELGRGGMATVWLAKDIEHDRAVALKVLLPEFAGAIGVDRFLREVRLTSRLQHPGIVPVFDSGAVKTADGFLPWYAMAYIEGESLRSRLTREMQLPVDEAVAIGLELAATLQAAHNEGIVHRDIKPENVILAGGRAYLVDFGISKALSDPSDERLTSTGIALGTPAYMSPEQSSGENVDTRTDQYSLAAVIYEMLAGEPPITGPSALAIIKRRFAEPARPIRPIRSGISESVETAVLRALERVPADRFHDIVSFARALTAEPSARAQYSKGKRYLAAPLITLALVATAGAGWVALKGAAVPTPPAVDQRAVSLYQRGQRANIPRTEASTSEAISLFKAAIEIDSNYSRGWSGLAKGYELAHRRRFVFPGLAQDSVLRLAVAAADRALLLDSADAEAWVAQAIVRRRVYPTDASPSLRAAQRATELDSLNGQAWHLLALGLSETGKMEQAIDGWQRVVRIGPTYVEGLAFLALGYYWHRQYDSAAVWADSAIALDPTYLLGLTTFGFIALERGEFARAVDAFDAGIRLNTDIEVPNTLANRAVAEARAGMDSEARATLRRADSLALTYVPVPAHTAVWLAQANTAVGNTDRAIWWLRRFAPQRELHYQLHLRCDPLFDPIAHDNRFRTLVLAQPGC